MKRKSTHELYVHGRSDREAERLNYQASKLAGLLHHDTRYSPGSRVLEAACGVGAQTTILAKNSPGAEFVSIDISPDSLVKAKLRVSHEGSPTSRFFRAMSIIYPSSLKPSTTYSCASSLSTCMTRSCPSNVWRRTFGREGP